MPPFVSDRPLWIVVCIGLGVACVTVPLTLLYIKEETLAPAPPEAEEKAGDGIQQYTLWTLSNDTSLAIRNSVIKITAARVVKPRVKKLLLQDLAGKNEDRRNDAINAISLLMYSPALNEKNMQNHFVNKPTIEAVITALVNILPEHERYRRKNPIPTGQLPPSPIRPPHRPAHEASLMTFLTHLLHYEPDRSPFDLPNITKNVTTACNAGLVTRWLANYPFPCSLPENSRFNYTRGDVANLFDRTTWAHDDMRMYNIMVVLKDSPQGTQQLLTVGLMEGRDIENADLRWSQSPPWEYGMDHAEINDVRMVGGEATAGIPRGEWEALSPFVTPTDAPRPRSMERSQEEELLRRRHRETVVVAEPGAPFGRENILQREHSRADPTPVSLTDEVPGELLDIGALLSDASHMPDFDSGSEENEARSSHSALRSSGTQR